MKVLVVSDLSRVVTKATCSLVRAAALLGPDACDLLVWGEAPPQTPEGVHRIFTLTPPVVPVAEALSYAVAQVGKPYDAILMSSSTFGKNVLPRAAALLGRPQISDVVAIEEGPVFVHPIYAGNILERLKIPRSAVMLTVRPTAFEPVPLGDGKPSLERLSLPAYALPMARIISTQEKDPTLPDLSTARVVVAGGRALGSAQNFKLIEELAATLGGAVAATRAAVDAGYAPNHMQVGQTGKTVAPDLYIAVGVSGAIQHLAGMKDSRVIVAINKDPEAPIFQIATYGLVGDLFEIVPQLIQGLTDEPLDPTRYGDWERKGRAIDF